MGAYQGVSCDWGRGERGTLGHGPVSKSDAKPILRGLPLTGVVRADSLQAIDELLEGHLALEQTSSMASTVIGELEARHSGELKSGVEACGFL